MGVFQVFVSTCKDTETLYKAQKDSLALDLPPKWSTLYEIEAESLTDAFQSFYKTSCYLDFINNNTGTFFNYYLLNGRPVLYSL
ncbi:MAG: hypothetical protein IKH13_07825 [Clostridia bacterium]|nr:hypothetical protein [Clostridia bacterium]